MRKLNQLPYNPALKEKAHALRKAGNLSEVLLWNALKQKQLNGLDFDRQRIIGNYIVDFFCHAIGLVLEIDGDSHDNKVDYDRQRDAFLQDLGLHVLHIQDRDVKRNLAGVLTQIEQYQMNTDTHTAAHKLAQGEVIALPTETVYGLAADASNPSAVAQIFALKNRPTNHPLITHIAADANIRYWVDESRMSDAIWRLTHALMAAFFPGPLTLVLPKHPQIDACVTGGQDTIALRSPNHAVFQDVLSELAKIKNNPNVGIAAPSANKFGRVSPTRSEHVRAEFGDAVWVLDVPEGDAADIGIESTIVDLTTGVPRILRFGHITPNDIQRVTGVAPILPHQTDNHAPRVSGSLLAHYAPTTPMVWSHVANASEIPRVALYYSDDFVVQDYAHAIRLPNDAIGFARGLYHALRTLDGYAAQQIVVETLPDDEAWYAVRDRLNRAVVGSNLSSHVGSK